MENAQARFDRALEEYEQASDLIRGLDERFRLSAGVRYDPEVTQRQFDIILQAILLQMSLADDRFDRLEQQFVDKLTRCGDLLGYLRASGEAAVPKHWKGIARMKPDDRDALLALLPRVLSRECDSFVKPLALADAADERDFLAELVSCLRVITESLSFMDGSSTEDELRCGDRAIVDMIQQRWSDILKDA